MPKFYNIAFAVLFLLTGVLFYMQWKGGKSEKNPASNNRKPMIGDFKNLPIAFFEIDSITEKYNYCIKIKAELEKMKDQMDNKITTMQSDYENIQLSYQKKAQTGMSQQEQEEAMMVLNKKQKEIGNKKQEFINQIEGTTKDFEIKLKKNIQDFIKEYNTPQRFSFIVADEPGIFYYRDTLFDITTDLLNGLNKNYKMSTKN